MKNEHKVIVYLCSYMKNSGEAAAILDLIDKLLHISKKIHPHTHMNSNQS